MIIPSIDLMAGKAVQLKQGREKMLEREDTISLAKYFDRFGQIAVIDLDAAMGNGDNNQLIRQICQIAECRVGGGIRDAARAKELISFGAAKIIIGTKAFENDSIHHDFLSSLAAAIGRNRIMIAIDAFNGEIVTKGWKHKTGLNLFDVVNELEQYATDFLFTCVEKEGGLGGTDMKTITRLSSMTKNKITAAGGITSMDEIKKLAGMGIDTQLGMAIYTGKLKTEDAFIESLDWGKGLIPTITCDTAGQVLMLAYSSRESIQKTFESGNMCYFSRSRNSLWTKGETSGNFQKFVRFRSDCDSDALLATVKQTGNACHLDTYSCFGDKKFSLHELHEVLKDRFENPLPGSYTAKLTDELLREKIMEEAQEVIEARTRDEIIWEAADVIYFITALLAKSNVTIEDVLNELRRRRRK